MPSCVMRFCTNYTNKTSKSTGITYHSFPLNELRRLKWVKIVRKQRKQDDWQPNNSSKICSIHFNNDDKYKSSKGLTLLKNSALPVLEVCHSSQPTPTSSNSLDEERISDMESIFETARKSALEKYKAIQQRWKTARDAYIRSKAILKTGAKAKKYFYFEHCSFLDKNEKRSTDEPPEKRLKVENPIQTPAQPSSSALSSALASSVVSPSSNGPCIDLIQFKQEYEEVEENLACEENMNAAGENDNDQAQHSDLGATNAQLHTELNFPLDIEYTPDVAPTSEVFNQGENNRLAQHLDYEIYAMLKETTEKLNNDNMAFFMSLLPIVNKFSDKKKLLFRSEVIKAAMELSSTEKDD